MDAARLLYGELDLDATSALFAVGQLDEGFDILADNINNSQDNLDSMSNAFSFFSDSADSGALAMESFYETLDEISKINAIDVFMFFANIIMELITSSESFRVVLEELYKAFEPLLKVISEFGEFIGKYVADVLLVAIGYLSTFINYLTKTEQGLALLKIAAIFFAVVAGVALIMSFKAIMASAYGALTAVLALIAPFTPFIAIAALVAAAVTTLILVLEDLYYFAMFGDDSSVTGGYFEMLGLNKAEIEEIRKSIKEFIETAQALWKSFTSGVTKLAPQFKKIFSSLISIVKAFFTAVFAYVLDLAKIFSGVWDIIKGIFTGNFDLILNGFSKIGDGITGIFKTMGNFIIKIFDNILEMMNPIKEIAQTIFGGKPAEVKVKGEIETPKKENATQSSATQVLPIAGQRASGGEVESGKTYLVGEKGAEIFTPSTSGAIIPNESINNSSNQSTMKTTIQSIIGAVNITIQPTENIQSDLSERIKEIIRQASIEAAQELGIVL